MIITEAQYWSDEFKGILSQSTFKHHFYECKFPKPDDPANESFLMGHVFENAIFGPEELEAYFTEAGSLLKKRPSKEQLKAYAPNFKGKIDEALETFQGFDLMGDNYAWVNQAMDMADTMRADPVMNSFINGKGSQHQLGIVNEVYGIKVRGLLDVFNKERRVIVDIKSCKDINEQRYSERYGKYVPFYIARGYDIQAAWYQLLVEKEFGFIPDYYLAMGDKGKPMSKKLMKFTDASLEDAREVLKLNMAKVAEEIEHGGGYTCGNCQPCREFFAAQETQVVEILPVEIETKENVDDSII